jgi:hypothetical protein
MGRTTDKDRGYVCTTIDSDKAGHPRNEQERSQDDDEVLGIRAQEGDLLQQANGQEHELALDHLHVGSKSPGNYGIRFRLKTNRNR